MIRGMSTNVYWLLSLTINEGKRSTFETLMGEMIENARENESGTTNYEWSSGEDGSSVHVYERYVDSDAAMAHIACFGEKFAARFLDCLTPTAFHLYGAPSDEVKGALADFGAVHMSPLGGFAR